MFLLLQVVLCRCHCWRLLFRRLIAAEPPKVLVVALQVLIISVGLQVALLASLVASATSVRTQLSCASSFANALSALRKVERQRATSPTASLLLLMAESIKTPRTSIQKAKAHRGESPHR